MCLAVPLKIKEINGDGTASVKQGASSLEVDISLLDDAVVGDYVIVHAGYAIEVLDLDEAQKRLDLFERIDGDNAV